MLFTLDVTILTSDDNDLFHSKVWVSCSAVRLVYPPRKWSPLITSYHGLRLKKYTSDVWIFVLSLQYLLEPSISLRFWGAKIKVAYEHFAVWRKISRTDWLWAVCCPAHRWQKRSVEQGASEHLCAQPSWFQVEPTCPFIILSFNAIVASWLFPWMLCKSSLCLPMDYYNKSTGLAKSKL